MEPELRRERSNNALLLPVLLVLPVRLGCLDNAAYGHGRPFPGGTSRRR